MIPSADAAFLMKARIYRPSGTGPFPLVLISHGSEQDAARRNRSQFPEYPALIEWFVQRGYVVVIPQRPGHGGRGKYLEDQGGCADADYLKAANGAADSIAAAASFMKRQDFVRPEGIVLVGHSAGALGNLAYAARRPAGIRAVVNFSGGRGGRHLNRPGNNCAPERLVQTAGRLGATMHVPTLWLYAENDSYFPPALSRAMADAFIEAGGRADYRLLPPYGSEGHFVIRGNDWNGALQDFLGRS